MTNDTGAVVRSRLGSASKRCRSTCGSYPQFYTYWKNQNFFLLTFTAMPFRLRCRLIGVTIFNILDSILKWNEWKNTFTWNGYRFGICRIRIDMPWMPFRFRQNDADPNGSGSTTLPLSVMFTLHDCLNNLAQYTLRMECRVFPCLIAYFSLPSFFMPVLLLCLVCKLAKARFWAFIVRVWTASYSNFWAWTFGSSSRR